MRFSQRPLFWMILSTPLWTAACTDGKDSSSTDDSNATDDSGATDDTGTSADCVEEGGACVLTGVYTESMTLTADKAWLLRGGVQIGDGTASPVLTIEAGTTVYGESASTGFLVINRGAQIDARGTASAPVVFTSDQAVGSRGRGQWGGLVLNGRAPINACTDGNPECEAEGEGGTGIYGGSDPADNSGTLSYVRIEYGGIEISPDNEINGLSLQGVGSATTVDHVQVHMNLDDGMEIFGGAVSVSHLVITGPGDDGIDWDLGWTGNLQFAVVQQHTDAGNNGIEADNNGDDYTAAPNSMPTVSNITLIGSEAVAEDNFSMLLRHGTAGHLYSVLSTDWSVGCLAIRDQETFDHFTSDDLSLMHLKMACDVTFEDDPEETETITEEQVFDGGTGNEAISGSTIVSPTNLTAPDFRLTAGSALLTGGMTPSGSFFESVPYVGAFNDTDNWTEGWTSFASN